MLLYLFFDSLLSTCRKKMETEKWPKAVDSLLLASIQSVPSRKYCPEIWTTDRARVQLWIYYCFA